MRNDGWRREGGERRKEDGGERTEEEEEGRTVRATPSCVASYLCYAAQCRKGCLQMCLAVSVTSSSETTASFLRNTLASTDTGPPSVHTGQPLHTLGDPLTGEEGVTTHCRANGSMATLAGRRLAARRLAARRLATTARSSKVRRVDAERPDRYQVGRAGEAWIAKSESRPAGVEMDFFDEVREEVWGELGMYF